MMWALKQMLRAVSVCRQAGDGFPPPRVNTWAQAGMVALPGDDLRVGPWERAKLAHPMDYLPAILLHDVGGEGSVKGRMGGMGATLADRQYVGREAVDI